MADPTAPMSLAEAVAQMAPDPALEGVTEEGKPGEEDAVQEAQGDDAPVEDREQPEDADTEEAEAEPETAEDDDTSDDDAEADGNQEEAELYTVKVAGKEHQVTLEELQAGYSKGADYDRKTAALAEQRREFEAAQTEAESQYRERFSELNAIISEFDQDLAKYENVDWAELEKTDPDEAGRLDRQMRSDFAKRDRAIQLAQQEGQRRRSEVLKAEQPKLLELIPEWGDRDVAKSEGQEIGQWMQDTYRVPEAEINNMVYAHHVDIARKAMLWDRAQAEQKKKRDVAKKKVAKVPKVIKPGTTTEGRIGADERIAKQTARVKESGNLHDLHKLMNLKDQQRAG